MNDQPCPDTLDLFNSAPLEPQQPPQATATAISDLEQQAKAFARQLAAKAIKQGYQPTHLHTYTDATGQPLYRKTRAKHPTWDSLTPEQQKATATAAGANGSKWIRAFHHDGTAFVAKEPIYTDVYPTGNGKKPLYLLHELVNADAGQAVYVVEGEQKADYLTELGLIATTSGGKSSASVTDWQPLAGRRVIIWRDFDSSGQDYQDTVIHAVSGLGGELWEVDVGILDIYEKEDVIDWQQRRTDNGLTTTAADVQELPRVKIESLNLSHHPQSVVSTDPVQHPQIEEGDGVPDGHLIEPMRYGGGRFEVLPNGLYFVDTDKEGNERECFVSSPIIVRAMTRSGTSQAWGRLLEWRDPDNKVHHWAMPVELLQGDGSEVRRELASRGVQIHPSKRTRDLFTLYLQSYPTTARALCVERLGWCGGLYVMPDRASGNSDQLTVFQNPHGLEPAFSQLGTLQQWRDHVAALATGNSRLGLAVSMAFAAVLADLVGEQGGGIHIRGGSSTGKSTALKMACSVWGNPEHYGREWRTTDNALEGLAALHNDGLLVLDELNQCDPRTVGQAVYMLANGQGKARMSKTGSSRPVVQWRVLFLSAGEESLSALMQQAGKRTNAGQEIRFAEITADAGQGMGMFEQIGMASSPQAFSDQIKDAAKRYHGTAGQAFLDHVTLDRLQTTEQARQYMQAFMVHVPSQATGQAHRVASRFALIAAGGEIATDAGITGWTAGTATEAARQCYNAWLESFGMIGNHEERAILAHVKGFFEAHGSSRFEAFYQPDPDKHERINNRAGYWKAEGDSRRYLVFPEQFKNEICKVYDHRQVSKILMTAGILVTAGDGRPDKLCRIPERDKATRMYEINSDTLFSDGYTGYNGYTPDSIGKNLVTNPKADLVTMVTSAVTDTASSHSGELLASVTNAVTSRNQPCNQAKTDSKTSNNNAVTNVTAVTMQKQPNPPITAVTKPQQHGIIEL
ncbi:MAG: DUF927 domain-containing protein [Moraxellaceae bacterium]